MKKNNWFLDALDLTRLEESILLQHIGEFQEETDKKVENGLSASKAAIEAAKVILNKFDTIYPKR